MGDEQHQGSASGEPSPPERLLGQARRSAVEGAYLAVGVGVLGLQRAQVRRRQLTKAAASALPPQLEDVRRSVAANLDATRAQLGELARELAPAGAALERRAEELEQLLPAPLQAAAAGARSTLRARLGGVPGRPDERGD